jgi:hypothetical protein
MAMKNWLITLASIALSLVAFELILRAVVPASGLDRFGSTRVENHEFSYVATHNSLGYRGEDFSRKSPQGTRRVLFIGDSFVYGTGVARAETIPNFLENKLNSLGGSKFEVLNLGLPDGNTIQYLETAKAFSDFDADIVLLGFYVDNDILLYENEADRFLLWSLVKNVMSILYYNISDDCRYQWVTNYNVDPFYEDLACKGGINPHLISRANRKYKNEQSYYRYMARQLLKNKTIIRNIKSIKKIFNGRIFYVTIFPSKYQISDSYFDTLRKIGFKFRNNMTVNNNIQLRLRKILERNDIDYIDLFPVILESYAAHGRKHYYDIDDHFNGFGNGVVATAIVKALRPQLVQ